ncbi:MAG: hypothetical protein EF813_06360 [Methanosarcinales archaeon]|nr:MAG: hypothetical protein EF813_06360 [Methanosarcinales archaeon]
MRDIQKKRSVAAGIALCMLVMLVVFGTSATATAKNATVTIDDLTIAPGENATLPIMVSNVTDLGGCDIRIRYDASVVHVVNITPGDMTLLRYTINNGTGCMHANTIDVTGPDNDVVAAYINLTAVGSNGDTSPLDIIVDQLVDVNYDSINYTVTNGTLTVEKLLDMEPPMIAVTGASRDTILNDNDRARSQGTNVTLINVMVNDDDSGVSGVTIDLSPVGGSPVQLMEHVSGTDIWKVSTSATMGVNQTHQLTINATDGAGNSNTTAAITLTVLRRGDVCRDNRIDMQDAMRISGYITGAEPDPGSQDILLVGDVVGTSGSPAGDGMMNLLDVLYIARYAAGMEDAP